MILRKKEGIHPSIHHFFSLYFVGDLLTFYYQSLSITYSFRETPYFFFVEEGTLFYLVFLLLLSSPDFTRKYLLFSCWNTEKWRSIFAQKAHTQKRITKESNQTSNYSSFFSASISLCVFFLFLLSRKRRSVCNKILREKEREEGRSLMLLMGKMGDALLNFPSYKILQVVRKMTNSFETLVKKKFWANPLGDCKYG